MSLADKIGEDGRGRKETAGQRVRVVEVPADTGGMVFSKICMTSPARRNSPSMWRGPRKHITARPGDLEKTKGFIRQGVLDARGGIEAAEVTNGIAAVRAFLSAHGSSRFETAWEEPPRDRDGNLVPPRIANQGSWRKRVILEDGEEAWDYLISADAWREASAGFNAGSLARTLVERGYLLPGGDGKSSRNEKIPSHGQRRVYHISHTLLGGGADG